MIDTLDIALRIAAGAGLGAAIGLERQWRSKMAGLRTNALVSLGSALFVLMGAYAFGAGDPTRVAAQVASGIGFLGAGVIIKQGASISGLNTAATLWASAAVGTLVGAGMYGAAGIGTGAVIAANVLLRPVSRALDRHRALGTEPGPTEYRFEVRCLVEAEGEVRALVVGAITQPHFTIQSISAVDVDSDVGGGEVRITAIVVAEERDDHAIETALANVITARPVTAVRWSAEDLSGVD
ncbi:putative Mg2+ transporter-C (MgtC) family protein [Mycolicibacterium fluoranthenivorans]|uniref:Putative Mg2+ transporter-C (MgtC) family protein n=1 Tax=Mycolicibacterium fluoranthenivorans TaxID=258505 RepID=A0A1G4WD90_9MYCO|nr:putative Mg2+ transporter-C (MgtC) family protein [Mycolicibacterium fluoranthenivorans]